MLIGTEYRILATRNKVIGIMSRIPANITGDGIHTIEKLVEIKNQHPWRGGKYALKEIRLGKHEKSHLNKSGWSIKDIPSKKQQVYLLNVSPFNIDEGGDTIDCTTIAHPSVAKIIMRAMRAVPGLTWAGMDFFSKDITNPQKPTDYIILEINTSPNIAWQEFPAVGKRKQVSLEYLKTIFPELRLKKRKKISRTSPLTPPPPQTASNLFDPQSFSHVV